MSAKTEMKLGSIAPWFGGKRTLAPRIAVELGEHSYYFEGCAGSMAVLFAKEPAHHETVCDLHGAMINLALVVQDERLAPELQLMLHRTAYADAIFDRSKEWLADRDGCAAPLIEVPGPCLDWAYHYFICSWMGRNGVAGTARVNYQIATRWTAGGGSGPLRFRNAIDSIPAWWERLRNVHILQRCLFAVLPKIEDAAGVAIYVDPPYFGAGAQYLHGFHQDDHVRLAEQLRRFKLARVVVSYYANPQLAELYAGWTLVECPRPKHLASQSKRGLVKAIAPEVLLLNGPSFTADAKPGELFSTN